MAPPIPEAADFIAVRRPVNYVPDVPVGAPPRLSISATTIPQEERRPGPAGGTACDTHEGRVRRGPLVSTVESRKRIPERDVCAGLLARRGDCCVWDQVRNAPADGANVDEARHPIQFVRAANTRKGARRAMTHLTYGGCYAAFYGTGPPVQVPFVERLARSFDPVSYTHLTLPTICSV